MIISRETINQLAEHPLPPMEGYVIIYGYGDSLWLMQSDGDKYDLLQPWEGGGDGGVVLWGQQGLQAMTADTWHTITFSAAMGDDQYTITPLYGLRSNGDLVPIKIKNIATTGFSAWAARDCTFRWAAIGT